MYLMGNLWKFYKQNFLLVVVFSVTGKGNLRVLKDYHSWWSCEKIAVVQKNPIRYSDSLHCPQGYLRTNTGKYRKGTITLALGKEKNCTWFQHLLQMKIKPECCFSRFSSFESKDFLAFLFITIMLSTRSVSTYINIRA